MSDNQTIELSDSNDRYILRVPYSEKERAKSIKGYSWDLKIKGWVYPKTDQVLNSIQKEFGDTLQLQLNCREYSLLPSDEPWLPDEEVVIKEGNNYTWKGTKLLIIRIDYTRISKTYSVELFAGTWPDDLDLITICDGDTPPHSRHFGGFISESDVSHRKVKVWID